MDELLIKKVRQHEVLYNHEAPEYRDQKIRQEAWEEIGEELKMTAEQVKIKWGNLRRCFCNAKNRRLAKKGGDISKKTTPWKFEQQMSFILPYLEDRRTQGNLQDSQNLTKNAEIISVLEEENDYKEQNIHDLQEEVEENIVTKENEQAKQQELQRKISEHQEPETLLENLKNQKQQAYNRNHSAQAMVEIMKENTAFRKRKYEEKSALSLLETMDETDLFFLSMSKMTKKLPKNEQANIKLTLSSAVLQAEVRHTQEKQCPVYDTYTPRHVIPPPQASSSSSLPPMKVDGSLDVQT